MTVNKNRFHYWSFLLDEEGQPIENASIWVYLAGTSTPAELYPSENGNYQTTPSVIYTFKSYEGADESDDDVDIIKTDENGFFEFWLGNVNEINGYETNQKFKINWYKAGIAEGQIDYVNIITYYPTFTWRGTWGSGVDYNVSDVVGLNKHAFVCDAEHTSSSTTMPGSGVDWSSYWFLLIESYNDEFTDLIDSPSSYVDAYSIYTVNGGANAIIESGVLLTPGANTFNITRGSASLDVAAGATVNIDANLTVEAASIVNQDLTTDADVEFHKVTAATVDATDIDVTTVDATTVNATTVNATTVDATDIDADDIDATDIDATTVDATTVNATTVNATDIDADDIDATNIDVTIINSTSLSASAINAANLVADAISTTSLGASAINTAWVLIEGLLNVKDGSGNDLLTILNNSDIFVKNYADSKAIELELMKLNFQYISWAQFAIFDDLSDETKRDPADPSTNLATVRYSYLDNGGDDTPDKVFGFYSKTYENITTITTSTSTSVGLNFLEDTTKSWFTDENKNLTLHDSGSNTFTVSGNTTDTLTVSGTPLAGAYSLIDDDPSYAVAFCSLSDSSNGGTGSVKFEVSFDDQANWQTFYDTTGGTDLRQATVAIANPGTDYSIHITLTNDGSGDGPIVYKFLVCTDPSPWRF
jgi:hypothetical protein